MESYPCFSGCPTPHGANQVQRFDLQKHPAVVDFFGNRQLPGAGNFLASLGIRCADAKFKDLGHNAGNDAVFACAGLLALCSLTEQQKQQYKLGQPLGPALDYSFVGFTLDKVNRRPGSARAPSMKSQRPPAQQNQNRTQPGLSGDLLAAVGRREFVRPAVRNRRGDDDDDDDDSDSNSDKIFTSQAVNNWNQ
ncbi:hypothetical protein PG985_011474 [Apiospora marii]|uniref:uncharacterized protein n=1 Tax=Apiospora marii TaxID=335849 RepID=UPI00312F06E9